MYSRLRGHHLPPLNIFNFAYAFLTTVRIVNNIRSKLKNDRTLQIKDALKGVVESCTFRSFCYPDYQSEKESWGLEWWELTKEVIE